MTRHALLHALWVVLASVAFAACGDSGGGDQSGDDIAVEEFAFEIGHIDRSTDGFQTLIESDDVEIVVGFQGLNFVDLALHSTSAPEDRLSALVDVAFPEAPDRDYSFRDNAIEFKDLIGHRRALLRVPIGQDVAVVAGSQVVLHVDLSARGWHAAASSRFRMVDDEQCFENPAGELECL